MSPRLHLAKGDSAERYGETRPTVAGCHMFLWFAHGEGALGSGILGPGYEVQPQVI